MEPIYKNLYQFSTYIPPMDFTIHQYLLASEPAIMFATGTLQLAEMILPQIKEILGKRKLGYIFVSHIESDECGGVSAFLREYPDVQVLCSGLAARELPGYGYEGRIIPVSANEELEDGELKLQFFDYPSEVHLQNGVVCLEKNSGICYSADLMLRYGNSVGKSIIGKWKDEISAIDEVRVPSAEQRNKLKQDLLASQPEFVAVGHGYCMKCDK